MTEKKKMLLIDKLIANNNDTDAVYVVLNKILLQLEDFYKKYTVYKKHNMPVFSENLEYDSIYLTNLEKTITNFFENNNKDLLIPALEILLFKKSGFDIEEKNRLLIQSIITIDNDDYKLLNSYFELNNKHNFYLNTYEKHLNKFSKFLDDNNFTVVKRNITNKLLYLNMSISLLNFKEGIPNYSQKKYSELIIQHRLNEFNGKNNTTLNKLLKLPNLDYSENKEIEKQEKHKNGLVKIKEHYIKISDKFIKKELSHSDLNISIINDNSIPLSKKTILDNKIDYNPDYVYYEHQNNSIISTSKQPSLELKTRVDSKNINFDSKYFNTNEVSDGQSFEKYMTCIEKIKYEIMEEQNIGIGLVFKKDNILHCVYKDPSFNSDNTLTLSTLSFDIRKSQYVFLNKNTIEINKDNVESFEKLINNPINQMNKLYFIQFLDNMTNNLIAKNVKLHDNYLYYYNKSIKYYNI